MRLFTGIAIPADVAAQLERRTQILRAQEGLRWSLPEKLHITTAFIGDWPEARLAEVKKALEAVRGPGPFEVQLAWIAWMPNERFPRALYTSAGPLEPLQALAAGTADVLRNVGVELEERAYRPHVTLSRVKGRPDLTQFKAQLKTMDAARMGGFRAASFHLYLSADGKYTKLREYPL